MALQSSGSIALSEIQAEFGGSNPISISEYYGEDTGIPASGTISFSDFYGTSSILDPAFSSSSFTASDSQTSGLAIASFELETDGDVLCETTGANGTWMNNGATTASEFEVFVTKTSGSALIGFSAVDTWLTLDSDRAWTVSTGAGSTSATISVSIRKIGTSTVLTSTSVDLSATSDGD